MALHVYGEAPPDLAKTAARRGLSVATFREPNGDGDTGLARNAAYFVRPDGYVGLADADARPDTLERYLHAHGLR